MTKSELLEILQGLQPDDRVENFRGNKVSDVITFLEKLPPDDDILGLNSCTTYEEGEPPLKLVPTTYFKLSEVTRWDTYLVLVGKVEMEVNQYTGKPRVKKKTQQERELGPDLIKVLRLYS